MQRDNSVAKAEKPPATRTARRVIERELRKTYGSVTRAARHLGMSRQGLYYRMQQLGIDPKEFR